MTETTEKPANTARKIPTPAERQATLEKQSAAAERTFFDKYEGPILRIPTTLNCRETVRAYKRGYAISVKNWYVATNTPRTQLKDGALAAKIEAGMLKKIEETIKWFSSQTEAGNYKAKEAGVDMSVISHGVAFQEETKVIGPVAMKLRSLYQAADAFLMLSGALYTYAEINSDEHNKNKFDVKNKLDAVATSIRNFRAMGLQKVNEEGKGRPGFKPVNIDGDDAGEVKGASTAPAGNVVPIVGADDTAAASTGDVPSGELDTKAA